MVTPPRNQPTSKMLHGGGEAGNKQRFQHHNPNHVKRNNQNNKAPTTIPTTHAASVQLQNSTVFQQKGRQQNHHRSKKHFVDPHQHPNRISPNPTNYTNNPHNNKNNPQQQRYNSRQTPPRQVTNQVIMNNGQPSLVELAPPITSTNVVTNPVQKDVVKNNSQKSHQDASIRSKKGHAIPNSGSRSSPVITNLTKSNRSSPQGFAGSKCFEPPTPNSLPKPPPNWTPFQFPSKQNLFGNLDILTFGGMTPELSLDADSADLDKYSLVSATARDVSQELKLILKVNA